VSACETGVGHVGQEVVLDKFIMRERWRRDVHEHPLLKIGFIAGNGREKREEVVVELKEQEQR
jgi:hypothetical protein